MPFLSYAQNFEDVLLWRALKTVENGVYIDIGAQDPVFDSVSRGFYEQGWRGVHIEPTLQYSEMLRANRPDEIVIQAAASDKQGLLTIFEFEGTGLSTGHARIAKAHRKAGWTATERYVPTVTLDQIMETVTSAEIHWLKIDVEGAEALVLRGWRTSAKRPWIVVIEAIDPLTRAENYKSWEPLILKKGYEFAFFDGLNRYYVSDSRLALAENFRYGASIWDELQVPATSRLANSLNSLHQDELNTIRLEAGQHEEALQRVQAELDATRTLAELAQRQLSSSQEKLEAAQAASQAATIETAQTLALLDSVNTQMVEARGEIALHRDAEEAAKIEFARAVAQLERALSDVSVTQDRLDASQADAQAARLQLERVTTDLSAHIETLKGELARKEVGLVQAGIDLEAARQGRDTAKARLAETQEDVAAQRNLVDAARDREAALRGELEVAMASLAADKADLEATRGELNSARAQLVERMAEIARHSESDSEVRAQWAHTRGALEQALATVAESRADLFSAIDELGAVKAQLTERLSDIAKKDEAAAAAMVEIGRLRLDLERAVGDSSDLTLRIEESVSEAASARAELASVKIDMAETLGLLRGELAQSQALFDQSQRDLDAVRQALNGARLEFVSLQGEFAKAQAETVIARDDLMWTRTVLDDTSAELRESRREIRELSSVTEELGEVQRELERTRLSLAHALADLDQKRSDYELLSADHGQVRQRLAEAQAAITRGEDDRRALTDQTERLEGELARAKQSVWSKILRPSRRATVGRWAGLGASGDETVALLGVSQIPHAEIDQAADSSPRLGDHYLASGLAKPSDIRDRLRILETRLGLIGTRIEASPPGPPSDAETTAERAEPAPPQPVNEPDPPDPPQQEPVEQMPDMAPMTWCLEASLEESGVQALMREEVSGALLALGHQIVSGPTQDPDAIPIITSSQWSGGPSGRPPILIGPDGEDRPWRPGGSELALGLGGVGCVSSQGLKVLVDHGVDVPAAVIGFGVDHWDRIEIAPEYVLEAKTFRFLHVSSCTAAKGLDVLLDSFGRVFSREDDVSLVIQCSSGPVPEPVRTRIDDLRRLDSTYPDVILIDGPHSAAELKALYGQCHVFVAPSRSEGFGIRIAQALYYGIPTVVTDWGGHLDYCDGSNSWLVDYHFEAPKFDSEINEALWATPWPSCLDDALEQSRTATDGERCAKALAGRRRLLARFTWKHVAARLAVLALQAQTRSQLSPTGSKVAWLSTYNVHCGIAGHVEHLLAPIPPDDVLILAGIQEPRVNPIDPPNCFRCWILNKDNNNWGDVRAIVYSNNVHAIIIQHSYGFFNHFELSSFMNECINMGVAVILELHTTVDPLGDTENFRIADLLGVLHRCHRIIVHSPVDADRLKSIGVVRNVTVLTLGVMRPQSDANRSGLQTPPLIASFGFSFPNKGLVELVQAVGILRDAGRPIRLRMLNAQSPNPISEVVVRDIQKTIKDLDLENLIEFRFDYLEDAVFIPLLSEADLIVNPYQQTGESASAAVRHELATGRPVAVTPLTIFDELGDAVFRLPGITPLQLADGIDDVLRHIASQSDTAQRVRTAMDQWIDQHDYAKHSKLYMALARSASVVGAATSEQMPEEAQRPEPVASAVMKRPRGAFVNTGKANCSIFESGKMVYACIQQSTHYDLDYYSLDLIDLPLFVGDGKLRIFGEDFERKSNDYDFWVFNWHFITMAPHVPNDVIRELPGPKFSVVLELEPDNPLAFIPPNVFDGFIALDPTAPPVENIYPFPRPLEGEPRAPLGRSSKVPVIGSFGYGTPGKGFGLLVEAVNREFDEAIIRINVPPGTYTASMDRIHLRDYPTYLADLCRRIAKPGIKVEFTNEFMSQEALVEWCAANDLNCFMYTRRQSGLSATTDQAIMSGQPLLTLSNDTFRHIHKFIPPYPVMGLKAAIKTTTPLVRIMQADWSKSAFVDAFHNMLRDFSVLAADSLPKAGSGGRLGPLGRKMVVASPRETHSGDILRHAKRVADALGRSGEYEIHRLQYDSVAELEGQIGADVEAIILDAATLDTKAAAIALNSFQGVKVFMTNDWDPRAPANATFLEIPRLPVIPFFTARSDLKAQWPSIWLIGFAAHDSNLEDIVSKILREAPDAELLFETRDVDRESLQARIEGLSSRPGKFSIQLAPTEGDALIGRLSEDHLSVFYNDPGRSEELLDMCSLALTTERAVTFTRAAPFAAFKNGATYIEDFSTSELIAMGISAQISLYHDLGEWQVFAKLHALLSEAFHDRALPRSAVG